jgi:branched-chain amino acid transport system substrate-binding protein
MSKKSKIILAALVSALAPWALAQAEDFKVGLVMPMTGPGADIARNLAQGANAAVPLVNARGGIGGMNVKMTICDSQSQEQQAIVCDRRLISDDKINLLMGNGSTPQTMAALPLVESAGVPLFSEAAGTAVYRPLKKWVFKAINSNEDQIGAEIDFLKHKGWTHVAIIRDAGPFGSDITATYKALSANSGVEIVADEVYAPTDTDMTAQVTRIRALKPDVVIDMAATAPPGAIIIKKIVQLGITAPVIVGANLQTEGFVNLIGDASDQIIFAGLKAVLSDLPKSDPLYDNVVAFKAEFAKINPGVVMNSLSPNVGDGLILAQAATKQIGARALDPTAFVQALETIKGVPGLQGVWTFSPTSHETSLKDGTALMRYANGKWVAAQ